MSSKNQKGFAIVYAMLFVMVIGVVLSMIYLRESSNARVFVKEREAAIVNDIEELGLNFYKAYAFKIDSDPSDVLNDGNEVITTYAQLASVTGMPQKDAWNVPFRLYISNRLTDTEAGFFYHDFYIVGAGPDHKFETVYDLADNQIIKGGDDVVIEISGKQIEGNYYLINTKKLYNLVRMVRSFAETLYKYNNFDKTKDFFLSQSCAAQGGGEFGCYANPTPISQTNLPSVMGITTDTYTDAYGNDFYFVNDSSDLSIYTPPYTAKIGMQMPGGKSIWVVFSYPL